MKIFSQEDNSRFAKFSGDINPLHLDPILARRLIYGSTVVHGIHLVLYSLNFFCSHHPKKIRVNSFKVTFLSPLKTGDEVICSIDKVDNFTYQCKLVSYGHVICKIIFSFNYIDSFLVNKFLSKIPPASTPLNPKSDEIEHIDGTLNLYLDTDLLKIYFSNIEKFLDKNFISILLSTTRLVGNFCPGLHSIYSELKLSLENYFFGDKLNYKVDKYDRRFQSVNILISCLNYRGHITSFIRPKPSNQEAFSSLQHLVNKNKFKGCNAFVIGGSRGIGEITTKLLVAGGANVTFSYFQGLDDARRVHTEISNYSQNVEFTQCDILSERSVKELAIRVSDYCEISVFYYATPFISKGDNFGFDVSLFHKFVEYYIKGLDTFIRSVPAEIIVKLFIPSTVFIEHSKREFLEYSTAKYSAEFYFRSVCTNRKNIILYMPRLPLMGTDQNASLMHTENSIDPRILLSYLENFYNQ